MDEYTVDALFSSVFTSSQRSFVPTELSGKPLLLRKVHSILEYIEKCRIDSLGFKPAGEERYSDWEDGWAGGGIYDGCDQYQNLPYYFKNNTHVRIGEAVYEDRLGFAEVDLLRGLQAIIFSTYLPSFDAFNIIEYGCGTGSNISYLSKLFPRYEFYGADWAESAKRNIVKRGILPADRFRIVNYFEPATFSSPPSNFIAFTNASLEQTGEKYGAFMDYLERNNNCRGGVHIEPMRELLDLSSLLNRQSFSYAESRRYLTDFSENMKKRDINIFLAKDFGIGSRFISGYQVLVWGR